MPDVSGCLTPAVSGCLTPAVSGCLTRAVSACLTRAVSGCVTRAVMAARVAGAGADRTLQRSRWTLQEGRLSAAKENGCVLQQCA